MYLFLSYYLDYAAMGFVAEIPDFVRVSKFLVLSRKIMEHANLANFLRAG